MKSLICPACGCSLVRLGIKAEDAISYTYNSIEYKFCCKACVDLFLDDPEVRLMETQDLIVCPTCLAEKPIASAVKKIFEDIELYFCRCPACLVLFNKNPQHYLLRLDGNTDFSGVFTDEERCCAANE